MDNSIINGLRNFFTIVGMGTTGIGIFLLGQFWWDKWGRHWICFHKHSYQVDHIWRIDDKERGCEKWDMYYKCEKCGKSKQITFWNDGVKLETWIKGGDTNG